MLLGIRSVQCQMQVEVAMIRVVQMVSYAETVKKVGEDASRVRDPKRLQVSCRILPVESDRPTNAVCFSKVGFLVFIAIAVNCPAGIECKITENSCCGGSLREVLWFTRF